MSMHDDDSMDEADEGPSLWQRLCAWWHTTFPTVRVRGGHRTLEAGYYTSVVVQDGGCLSMAQGASIGHLYLVNGSVEFGTCCTKTSTGRIEAD